MPSWCTLGTLYKGLFIIVLALIALEYLFGSIADTKSFFVFNTTRAPHQPLPKHSPLLSTLLHLKQHNSSNSLKTSPIMSPSANLTRTFPSPSLNSSLSNNNNSTELAKFFETTEPDTTNKNLNSNATVLPPCPDVSQNLRGRVEVVKSPVPTVQQLEQRFSWLQPGGHWAPTSCRVPTSVALIIPFRCRGEHLLLFLQHMHPFLRRQEIDYTIYIVEQEGDGPFNRAMLMNVGFTEALKDRKFDCFVFHDVDLLPEDDRNVYGCAQGQPRHMSVAVDIFKYHLPYRSIFGGVSAMTRQQFQKLNGFSNSFWGWGGEDDDMSNRIIYHNMIISRYPISIARYTMLTHKKDKPSPNRYDVLKQGHQRYDKDGLNSLTYRLVQKKKNLLYTWLLVGLDMPS